MGYTPPEFTEPDWPENVDSIEPRRGASALAILAVGAAVLAVILLASWGHPDLQQEIQRFRELDGVAYLPTTCAVGHVMLIKDGLDAADCTVGGGNETVHCVCWESGTFVALTKDGGGK